MDDLYSNYIMDKAIRAKLREANKALSLAKKNAVASEALLTLANAPALGSRDEIYFFRFGPNGEPLPQCWVYNDELRYVCTMRARHRGAIHIAHGNMTVLRVWERSPAELVVIAREATPIVGQLDLSYHGRMERVMSRSCDHYNSAFDRYCSRRASHLGDHASHRNIGITEYTWSL